MQKVLTVKNLSLTYQNKSYETTALSDISFDLHDNEFISIVGPSGCGKSTLLSIISGLLKDYEGEVVLNGHTPSTKDGTTGYMFQKDNLLPWRTIEKNLILGLEIKGKKNKESITYAKHLAKKYGIGDFLKKYPNELSGGMRQRVALIRTLVLKPQLLLLDEPFSALDFTTRLNLCDDVFKIIKNEHKSAILVTHDIQEAISMSDRIIVLSARPGKIKAIHKTNFSDTVSPFDRRTSEKSKELFDIIWKEIKDEDSKI